MSATNNEIQHFWSKSLSCILEGDVKKKRADGHILAQAYRVHSLRRRRGHHGPVQRHSRRHQQGEARSQCDDSASTRLTWRSRLRMACARLTTGIIFSRLGRFGAGAVGLLELCIVPVGLLWRVQQGDLFLCGECNRLPECNRIPRRHTY